MSTEEGGKVRCSEDLASTSIESWVGASLRQTRRWNWLAPQIQDGRRSKEAPDVIRRYRTPVAVEATFSFKFQQ